MSAIQLPIRNFAAQQSIFDSKARYIIVPKGRRFGMTRGAANNYIKIALSRQFTRGLWVDTVNANIERYVDRYFIPALKLLPQGTWKWQKQQKILRILDAYIDFRSVDNPENIEGFDYDYAFLNEAGIILKDEYLWHNAIKPMLWDKKCRTVVGGTPKGQGVFHDLYNRGLDKDQVNYQSFTFTSFDNPYAPRDLIKEDINTMPQRVVEQEIYAKFLDDTGVVFRGVRDIAIMQPMEPMTGHIYVIGCDLAKVQDYTVLVVYDRATNQQVAQLRFNKLEWPFQKDRIRETARKYNNALVMLDATGIGDPIADDLLRSGVAVQPIHLTNEIKKQIIEKLANWIELRNLRILNLDETIQELQIFTYDLSEKTGRVIYGAPVGFHDDIVIAHALACWSLNPLYKTAKPKTLGPIEKDFKDKAQSFDNQDGGEYGEYEDNDTNYGYPY